MIRGIREAALATSSPASGRLDTLNKSNNLPEKVSMVHQHQSCTIKPGVSFVSFQ